MPFRLRSNESIADGLRRLARQELGSVAKHLKRAAPPRDDAIHEIRKSVKKTRAILQVLDATLDTVGGRYRRIGVAIATHRIGREHGEVLRQGRHHLAKPGCPG